MTHETSINAELDYTLVILIKEILSQIDELAVLKKRGRKAGISQALLRETCSVLRELGPEQTERYFEILVKTTVNVKALPAKEPSEEYLQASQRPRRRTVSQVREALGLRAA